MIKTRLIKVKSTKNKEIIMAMKMMKIIITTIIIFVIVIAIIISSFSMLLSSISLVFIILFYNLNFKHMIWPNIIQRWQKRH